MTSWGILPVRRKISMNGSLKTIAAVAVVLLLAQLGVGLAAAKSEAAGVNTWYLAEGFTGPGFQEYLCVGNPGGSAASVNVAFLFNGVASSRLTCTVPARSRYTVDVNAVVGEGREVSAIVTSASSGLAVERSQYFVYQGAYIGSHVVSAARSLARAWYFAEGYTGPGFDEYVSVLNPGALPASLTFRFQTPGGELVRKGTAAAGSRATFKVNDLLGPGIESSLALESDQPVIAERPTYFSYQGVGSMKCSGGHCVMGATAPGTVSYFAEGTTRAGFQEWLTLQNTNARAISVTAAYQFGPGQGQPLIRSYTVAAKSRHTLYVPTEAGAEKDVSVRLTSRDRFLAERPMYFDFSHAGSYFADGNCAAGAQAAGSQYVMAEGYTGPYFEEWLSVQNPSSTPSTVAIEYFTQEKGALPTRTLKVPGNTRSTVLVNSDAGPNLSLSTRVTVKSGPGVVVERPIFVDPRGNPALTVNHDGPPPVDPVTPPAPAPAPDPAPTPTPDPTPTPVPPPDPPPPPPAPANIVMHGMCFSPYLTSWNMSIAQLSSLLDKIAPYSQWIRTFGSEGDWDTMLNLAKSKGFHVAAGADIWSDQASNQAEVNQLIAQVQGGKVDRAVVGDEMLENNALTQDQMIGYLRQVRATGVPTSTSQSAYYWLQTPRVIAECDFITMNIYPFWDQVSINNAISDVDTQYKKLQAIAGGKQIIIETGWPTAGQTSGQAVPSSANAARYLKDFMAWAKTKGVDYYYFEAFDESWKVEGGCGPHWGLWGTDATLKPEYSAVLNPPAQ